jgi:hypothetical protein
MRMTARSSRGAALIVAMMAVLLLSALGAALALVTASESAIAGRFRDAHESLAAADAVLERAGADLLATPDWTVILDGSVRSSFVDGAPGGVRLTSAGPLDLSAVANIANCGRTGACTDAEMDAVTAERPWGRNNPRWQLYAFGPLRRLLPAGGVDPPFYVVVLVGDDPAEDDGDPARDGEAGTNPGAGVVVLRAESFGRQGVHSVVEATVARADSDCGAARANPCIRVLSWRLLR